MCLIVAKPQGTSMPSYKKLKMWFDTHPDGFGLAFTQGNKVHILKGALSKRSMHKLLAKAQTFLGEVDMKDTDVIIHFRQATNGNTTPSNCHPFPITKDQDELSSLDVLTDCALAHNGIIWASMTPHTYWEGEYYGAIEQEKTDTQELIEDYLVDLGDSLWNPAVQRLIAAYSDSKFALLSSIGITLIGKFIEEDGYWYSNGGYLPPKLQMIEKTVRPSSLLDYAETDEDTPFLSCGGCDRGHLPLYEYLEDGIGDDSLVCAVCFEYFYNRPPVEEEKVVY